MGKMKENSGLWVLGGVASVIGLGYFFATTSAEKSPASKTKVSSTSKYSLPLPATEEEDEKNMLKYVSFKKAEKGVQEILELKDCIIKELAGGNLNYVFRLENPLTNKSIILKRSIPYIRVVGEGWPLKAERIEHEYNIIQDYRKLGGVLEQMVPQIYFFDSEQFVLCMKDLAPAQVLRKELMLQKSFPLLGQQMGEFLGDTLFFLSNKFLSFQEHSLLQKKYLGNFELIKLTVDVIFTQPFQSGPDIPNSWSTSLDDIVKELQASSNLKIRKKVLQLRDKFVNNNEALLHGDLHTGSIMVTQSKCHVIDFEFCFVGPRAFELGILVGNLLLSYFSQPAHGEKAVDMQTYILQQIQQLWTTFVEVFCKNWEENFTKSSESLFFPNFDSISEIRKDFFAQLLHDLIGFAGCVMIRRVIGIAKADELSKITEESIRAPLEKKALTFGIHLLVESQTFESLDQLLSLVPKWNPETDEEEM